MTVTIRLVNTRSDLRTSIFIFLRTSGRNHSNWLPPIYMDEWTYQQFQKTKLSLGQDTCLSIAYKDGKPAGRIMGIINRTYNELQGEKLPCVLSISTATTTLAQPPMSCCIPHKEWGKKQKV
ncbi:MAG: hypothetical protein IPN33_26125 [Saprospiraceae bacterium]|nr:hypothetical protein [Saprospiraceae bacterium]